MVCWLRHFHFRISVFILSIKRVKCYNFASLSLIVLSLPLWHSIFWLLDCINQFELNFIFMPIEPLSTCIRNITYIGNHFSTLNMLAEAVERMMLISTLHTNFILKCFFLAIRRHESLSFNTHWWCPNVPTWKEHATSQFVCWKNCPSCKHYIRPTNDSSTTGHRLIWSWSKLNFLIFVESRWGRICTMHCSAHQCRSRLGATFQKSFPLHSTDLHFNTGKHLLKIVS